MQSSPRPIRSSDPLLKPQSSGWGGRSGPYSTGAAEDRGGVRAREHRTEAGWPRVKVRTGLEPGTDATLPRALRPTG